MGGNKYKQTLADFVYWQIQWIWSAMFKRLPGIGIQFKAY